MQAHRTFESGSQEIRSRPTGKSKQAHGKLEAGPREIRSGFFRDVSQDIRKRLKKKKNKKKKKKKIKLRKN